MKVRGKEKSEAKLHDQKTFEVKLVLNYFVPILISKFKRR